MLFEVRKIMVGFRLKLTFDEPLSRENAIIFVDISVTPTVGSLVNSIIERFELPNNTTLRFQNCKLLHSENVRVLCEADSAKVIVPSMLENVPMNLQTNLGKKSNVPLSDLSHGVQNTELDEIDVVDGKSSSQRKSATKKQSYSYGGIAETLRMCVEEELFKNIEKKCSTLSLSSGVAPTSEKNRILDSSNITDNATETSFDCDEMSDLPLDNIDDSDMSFDKKKRKRSRKRSKKATVSDQSEPNFTPKPVQKFINFGKNIERQHIHFSDVDDEENSIKPNSTNEEIINSTSPTENDSIQASNSLMETDEAAVREINSTPVIDTVKETNSENESTFTSAIVKKLLCNRPKSSLSNFNGKITKNKIVKSSSGRSPAAHFIQPVLAKSSKNAASKNDQAEKELSTLLMCKQLNSCMQYSVQYANDSTKNQSPLKRPIRSNVNVSKVANQPSAISSENHRRGSQGSVISISDQQDSTALLNVEAKDNSAECMEESYNDCEVLQQVKVVANRILIRKPQGTWTVLTPEIANGELSKLDVPKENQSIVFRLMYLNESFIPTVSDLVYGQVIKFNSDSNKLAVDIPPTFVDSILKNCVEDGLAETLIPITGTTFEIGFSNLIEPRVIS